MKKEYIAYQDEEYTIEWYFDINGKSQALEYFEGLEIPRKVKVIYLFKVMALTGTINNIEKFRNEGNEIYAFKPQPDRFLCFFFEGKKIIITNAFEKRQDKLPPNEKKKALAFKEDYIKRCKIGEYYD
jgi:hypothetical protein